MLVDTDTLDLVQDIFIRNQNVQETSIDKSEEKTNVTESLDSQKTTTFNTESYVKGYSEQKNVNGK